MSLVVVVVVVVEQSNALAVHVLLVVLGLDLVLESGLPEQALHSVQSPYVIIGSSQVVCTVQQSLHCCVLPDSDVAHGLPGGHVLVCV